MTDCLDDKIDIQNNIRSRNTRGNEFACLASRVLTERPIMAFSHSGTALPLGLLKDLHLLEKKSLYAESIWYASTPASCMRCISAKARSICTSCG